MKPGGTLRIIANNRAGKSEDDQPYIEMIFEDTGRGNPVEVMKHIFEPFYTTKSQGTGLGLFISYRIIVEKHGGIMDVTSIPSQGTRFRVCLPAS